MLLHRIHLNRRSREARRDLADPYQLHSTLCRAFVAPTDRLAPGDLLWRLEPESDALGNPRLIVQSRVPARWERIEAREWLAAADSPLDLTARLRLAELDAGTRFRFRLRANPCVTRGGKRFGLMRLEEQHAWLIRKGGHHGFSVDSTQGDVVTPSFHNSEERMLTGRQHNGNRIRVFSVLFDGIITVTEPTAFVDALHSGIGHGKALGLGLLSIAAARAFGQ